MEGHSLEFLNKLATSPAGCLFHLVLLDHQRDAFQRNLNHFCSSIAKGLASVGCEMSDDADVASVLDVSAIMKLLHTDWRGVNDSDLYCPQATPSVGVVSCTYQHWFQPCSKHRRYCQLPVSGRRMQRFLQFRLSSHTLPIVTGSFASRHVDRSDRVCSHCANRSVADEMHAVFECHALQPWKQHYAPSFSSDTDTMTSCFGQKDHMQVFRSILGCVDFLEI